MYTPQAYCIAQAFGYNKLKPSLTENSLCDLSNAVAFGKTNCGCQYNDQIAQEYGHYKTFWRQWLPQFVVAKGNNIFDATERLFNAGCCYISLWLKAISLENSKGKLFWPPTVHCGITMATKIRFSSKLCL